MRRSESTSRPKDRRCSPSLLRRRAPSTPRALLSVAVHPHRSQVVVAPRGEVDLSTVEPLHRALDELRDVGFNDLVVDLRGIAFLDSSGLQLLLAYARTADADGFRFRLVHGPAEVRRLLEITGTEAAFEFVERPRW